MEDWCVIDSNLGVVWSRVAPKMAIGPSQPHTHRWAMKHSQFNGYINYGWPTSLVDQGQSMIISKENHPKKLIFINISGCVLYHQQRFDFTSMSPPDSSPPSDRWEHGSIGLQSCTRKSDPTGADWMGAKSGVFCGPGDGVWILRWWVVSIETKLGSLAKWLCLLTTLMQHNIHIWCLWHSLSICRYESGGHSIGVLFLLRIQDSMCLCVGVYIYIHCIYRW